MKFQKILLALLVYFVCSPVWAAWTVNTGTVTSATSNTAATSTTINAPTGITNGDLLVLTVVEVGHTINTDPGLPTVTGWTVAQSDYYPVVFFASLAMRQTVLYKLASSEGASYSIAWTNSATYSAALVDISGNKSSSPLDLISSTGGTTGTYASSVSSPTLSGLSGSSDLLITVYFDQGGGQPYTPPTSPMDTIYSQQSVNNGQGNILMSYQALSGSSASAYTGAAATSTTWDAFSVAFLPSGGAGSTPHNLLLMGVGQ